MKTKYSQIREDREINLLIEKGNEILGTLGYTEHSRRHAARTAETAAQILKDLGYKKQRIELAKIAGYMHDIGNSINRHDHAHSGAMTGNAVDEVSAALILADKTDVRRNRVQNPDRKNFDIHDRVNYAALSSQVAVDREKRVIQMTLQLDDRYCSLVDYFEIFLERMIMCRRAAERLNCRFKLTANGSKLL